MTEDEAKEKWCPMVFGRNTPAFNRDACFDMAGTHCIGSACMMWRVHLVSDGISPIEYIAHGGHCGLAGKP